MKTSSIKVSQITQDGNYGLSQNRPLYASYYIHSLPIIERFKKYINKYNSSARIKFGDLVQRVSIDEISKDDLIIKTSPNGGVLFELASGNTNSKALEGGYRPRYGVQISTQYILWFLSQSPIKDYLNSISTGSVLRRVSLQNINDLEIVIPKAINNNTRRQKVILSPNSDPVREIIREYYEDYLENYNSKRYKIAIIIAGAICEAILYESLIELGIPEKILSNNKTLGTLIEYAQIKELDKHFDINITHFQSIMRNRNQTIHVGSAIKILQKGEILNQEIFKDFDKIIEVFGI